MVRVMDSCVLVKGNVLRAIDGKVSFTVTLLKIFKHSLHLAITSYIRYRALAFAIKMRPRGISVGHSSNGTGILGQRKSYNKM